MINLLPPQIKREIEIEREIKIIVHIGVLFLSFLLSFSLLLSIFENHFKAHYDFLKEDYKWKEKVFKLDLEKEIEGKNRLLKKILGFENQKRNFSPILKEVIKAIPPNILLQNLSIAYEKSDGKRFVVTLSGIAKTRNDLIALRDTLQQRFINVTFPTDVWLKESEIPFSVHFKEK